MDKQSQLNQIADLIVENNVCPELAGGATQLVFGDGNPDADIVFIGEAPGKKEDEQGKPFVGAAGKFLDEMIQGIGLERGDVYITNIVKYRPPQNRDPLPEEKQAFWPYLTRQLQAIDPLLIVTLGRHSMEYFLSGQRISYIHGQPKRIKAVASPGHDSGSAGKQAVTSWVILPLYHPAAALYNGGMRETLIDDFSRIPPVLERIKTSIESNQSNQGDTTYGQEQPV